MDDPYLEDTVPGVFLLRVVVLTPQDFTKTSTMEFNFLASVGEVAEQFYKYFPLPDSEMYYVGNEDGDPVNPNMDLAEHLATTKSSTMYVFTKPGTRPSKVHVSSPLKFWSSGTLTSRFNSYLDFISVGSSVSLEFKDDDDKPIDAETSCRALLNSDLQKVYVRFRPYFTLTVDIDDGIKLAVDSKYIQEICHQDELKNTEIKIPELPSTLPLDYFMGASRDDEDSRSFNPGFQEIMLVSRDDRVKNAGSAPARHYPEWVKLSSQGMDKIVKFTEDVGGLHVTADTLAPIFDKMPSVDWTSVKEKTGKALVDAVAEKLQEVELEFSAVAAFAVGHWEQRRNDKKTLLMDHAILNEKCASLESEVAALRRPLALQVYTRCKAWFSVVFGNRVRNEAFVAVFYASLLTLIVQRSKYASNIIICVWVYAVFSIFAVFRPGWYSELREQVGFLIPLIYPEKEYLIFDPMAIDYAAKQEFNDETVDYDPILKSVLIKPRLIQKIAISIVTIIPIYWKTWSTGVRDRKAEALSLAREQVEERLNVYKGLKSQLDELMQKISQSTDDDDTIKAMKAEAVGLSKCIFLNHE